MSRRKEEPRRITEGTGTRRSHERWRAGLTAADREQLSHAIAGVDDGLTFEVHPSSMAHPECWTPQISGGITGGLKVWQLRALLAADEERERLEEQLGEVSAHWHDALTKLRNCQEALAAERDRLAAQLEQEQQGRQEKADDLGRALRERDEAQTALKEELRSARVRQRYPERLTKAREIARQMGYAIGLHGSEARDLDLIAAPWVDDVAAPEELARAIAAAVEGVISDDRFPQPECRPHGRLGWSIRIGAGAYIDLSVLPRRDDLRGLPFAVAERWSMRTAVVERLTAELVDAGALHLADEQSVRNMQRVIDRLTAERDEAVRLLLAILNRLDEVGSASSGVFSLAAVHGWTYTGPTWEEPYKAARVFLATLAKEKGDA